MKVLSISTDRNIFKKESSVRARMVEYGTLFDELHIVIFSQARGNFKSEQISPKVWVYPTNSWSRFFYVKNAVRLASKIIKERKFDSVADLITVQDPFETGLVGTRIKKQFKLPLHVQIHTDFLSPYFSKDSLLNKFRVLIAKKVLPQANRIRVVSERIKKSISQGWWGNNVHANIQVLPIFVDIKKIEEAPVQTDLKDKYRKFNFIILMASRLTQEKDIPTALFALAEVVKKYPRVGLIIVGEGKEEKNLRLLVNNLNLKENVVFEGWQNDLVSYYKSTNLFLLSSTFEGYGMTLVEAVASHCPIISTDVGIAPEVLMDHDTTPLCPVGDASCFARHIIYYIEDNALRERVTHEARNRLGDVTLENKEKYLEQYKWGIMSTLQKQK